MPVMTGFELVNKLRQNIDFQKTPILALSASTYPLDESESLKIGCNGFMSKPVDAIKLFQFIESNLPIEWLYQENNIFDKAENYSEADQSNMAETTVELIFPPPEQLKILYELASLGKVLQIEDFTEQLKKIDQRYIPFAKKISSMAAAFQDEQIVEFIKPHLLD